MKRTIALWACILTVLVCLCPVSSFAVIITPYIEGTSTATEILEGEYKGWFLYEISIDWNLDKGMSHWDMILKPGCAEEDHIILFDTPAGYSSGGLLSWLGKLEKNGDKSLDPEITDPVIKYEPQGDAGNSGSGTFYFYSNIIPEYKGPYLDILVAKAGNEPDTYGDLTGAYPSCNIVPEPATIILLGSGLFVLIQKKRGY